MTRYPKHAPYIPIHDCYNEKLVFNLEKDLWECPICGVPYHSPQHPLYVFPPEERPAFFKPFWMKEPNLKGSKGDCSSDFTLEPGNKVRLKNIRASVLVKWFPWKNYEVR